MSYNYPKYLAHVQCRETGKITLCTFTPTGDVQIKYVTVMLYLRGLLASGFGIKLNVYADIDGESLLLSSNTVLNTDIDRASDWVGEIRFDFEKAGNLLAIGHTFLLELELVAPYSFDESNYVGLVLDWDSPLAILGNGANVIRHSAFYAKFSQGD